MADSGQMSCASHAGATISGAIGEKAALERLPVVSGATDLGETMWRKSEIRAADEALGTIGGGAPHDAAATSPQLEVA